MEPVVYKPPQVPLPEVKADEIFAEKYGLDIVKEREQEKIAAVARREYLLRLAQHNKASIKDAKSSARRGGPAKLD